MNELISDSNVSENEEMPARFRGVGFTWERDASLMVGFMVQDDEIWTVRCYRNQNVLQ